MRSIIVLCFLVAATAAVAIPFEAQSVDADGNVSHDVEEHAPGEEETLRIGRASCNPGLCLNICYGVLRPPFRAQCISASTCRCTKL